MSNTLTKEQVEKWRARIGAAAESNNEKGVAKWSLAEANALCDLALRALTPPAFSSQTQKVVREALDYADAWQKGIVPGWEWEERYAEARKALDAEPFPAESPEMRALAEAANAMREAYYRCMAKEA